MIKTIKDCFYKIVHANNTKFVALLSLLLVCSFSCCFFSGMVNPSVEVEKTADYIADVAKNHTVNGKYVSLIVEPKEDGKSHMIDTGTEIQNLYGVFRENIASYASCVNSNHQHDVYFNDIKTENLSFLYVTSGFETVEYHNHYKHQYYPLEAMFMRVKDPETWGKTSFGSLIYISESQANSFLDAKGLEHTEENYASLLKTRVLMTIDGVEMEWQIEDIYLETNYFYAALRECAGEFVFAFSRDGFLNMKKQSMYFLSSYSFRNSFYIDYAKSLYTLSDYDYIINDYNFIDGFKIDESRLIFDASGSKSAMPILFIFLGSLLLLASLSYLYLTPNDILWWHHLICAFSSFVPYLFFKLFYSVTKQAAVFSTFSTNVNIIMLSVYFVLYFAAIVLKVRKKNATVIESV